MTPEERGEMLAILSANSGFDDPRPWVDYARRNRFQRIHAKRLRHCPDCRSSAGRPVGRYIYYSTLIRLIECEDCGLVWADTRIDDTVIRRHFETAYKDGSYFARERRDIFMQIAALVASRTPPGGSVIDIGGATGQQLAIIRDFRPDLQLTLNDLSQAACVEAGKLSVATHCGDLPSLLDGGLRYDTVICSDVLYYVPEIDRVWSGLCELVKPGGLLLIRVPNKSGAILGTQRWLRTAGRVSGRGERPATARVPFFNPEHLYIFRREYLERRLAQNGFKDVSASPSYPLTGGSRKLPGKLLYKIANAIWKLSSRRAILTPSLLIIAPRAD